MRGLASMNVGCVEPSFPGWVFWGDGRGGVDVVRVIVCLEQSEKRDVWEVCGIDAFEFMQCKWIP
jgi:hypothetical protein